jgi:hypothetical protein
VLTGTVCGVACNRYRLWSVVFYFKSTGTSGGKSPNSRLWFLSCGSIRLMRLEHLRHRLGTEVHYAAPPTTRITPNLVLSRQQALVCANCARSVAAGFSVTFKQIVHFYDKRARTAAGHAVAARSPPAAHSPASGAAEAIHTRGSASAQRRYLLIRSFAALRPARCAALTYHA